MVSKIIKLDDSFRFHARPAGMLAAKAKEYESVVMLVDGEKFADAKNFLSVMGLGKPGAGQIELIADGNDESEAVVQIEELLIRLE